MSLRDLEMRMRQAVYGMDGHDSIGWSAVVDWADELAALPNQECMKAWDKRGGHLYLDREECGVVVDALIEHKASADKRKGTNPESNSDARSEMCAEIIVRINSAALNPGGSRE